jgi:hypothetical protein
MNNLLRFSCIQALLSGLVMVAVPAGASAQSRFMGPRMGSPGMAGFMGPRMGNPGMAGRPGSAAMTGPSRSMMTPAMQPMSPAGGGTAAMSSGRYGMAPYDTQSYGATGGSADPQANAAELQPSTVEKNSLLTASGVPNDRGQLRWPIGLAILAAPGADVLREQIDALFDEAARQVADGSVNPALAEEVRQAVKKLRRLLLKEKAERLGMPLAVYQESERFLNKLDRAQQLFRAGGQRRSKTEGSSTSDSLGSPK